MSLQNLFTREPTDRVFAWIGEQAKTERDFFHDVECWRVTFEKAGTRKVIVYSESTYFFACTLFAAWLNSTTTILPADATAQTLVELASLTDTLVTDTDVCDPHLTILREPERLPTRACPPAIGLTLTLPLVELFTSGSTGTPVLITKRLEQLFCELGDLAREAKCDLASQSVVVSSVPHQHIYGFLWRFLWPIHQGYALTDERVLYPENLIERLKQFQSCIFVSSPAVLKRLPSSLGWHEAALHCQLVTSSGGPLSDDGFFNTRACFNRSPFEILGSTELDGIACRTRTLTEQGAIDPQSALWQPMPGVKIRPNDDGVMLVSSIRLPTLSWQTGSDIIAMHPDNRFELKKRVDRIVKIEEKRISLDQIEATLLKSGLIEQCKAFLPNQNTHRGLAVVAVPAEAARTLLRQDGKLALVKRLKRELSYSFESLAIAKWWRFEPALPVDERGKISQKILQRTLSESLPALLDWSIDTHSARLLVWVSPNMPQFEGHFEDFSLLPGVAQLQWAIALAHRHLNTPLTVDRVNNLKFMAPVLPGSKALYCLNFDVQKMTLSYKLVGAEDDSVTYSSGLIHFH